MTSIWALCALVLAGSLGCKTPTQLLVRFDAEPATMARARAIHVVIDNEEGVRRLDRTVALGSAPGQVSFPTRVPVVPRDNDASRSFSLRAELTDSTGRVFSTQRAILGFVPDTLFEVNVLFDDLCIDELACPESMTCRQAACVDAHLDVGAAGPVSLSHGQPAVCDGDSCIEHPRPTGAFLFGVCIDEPNVSAFVVGAGGAALRRDSGIWYQDHIPSTATFRDVACSGDGVAVAVGVGGALAVRDRTGWHVEPSGVTTDLFDVAVDGEDTWMVGAGGVVLRRRGGVTESIPSGTSSDLLAVTIVSPTEVWVSGAGESLLRYDGAAFVSEVGPPTDAGERYTGVVSTSAGLLVSSARPQAIHRRTASGWERVLALSESSIGLYVDPSTGWGAAAGGRGDLIVGDPTGAWSVVGNAGGANLTNAAVVGSEAYFVGPSGELVRWSVEAGWQYEVERATRVPLNDVSFDQDQNLAIAVGNAGTLLERATDGHWTARAVLEGDAIARDNLAAVHAGESSIAVGVGGLLAERREGTWRIVSVPTTQDLLAVDARGARVVAGGVGGTIIEGTDGAYTTIAAPSAADVTAVLLDSGGQLYVGTSEGEVYRGDGGGFTLLGVGTQAVGAIVEGDDVVRVAAGHLYRVTDAMLVEDSALRIDGCTDVSVVGSVVMAYLSGATVYIRRAMAFESSRFANRITMTPEGLLTVGNGGAITLER